ncbi:GntR family transcriptional regulator [Micromonospora sp. NBC_01699]|uniref:GntR family transcriptional regulator n=1 Tax=Micromonospora sp. NBC_01699 TaxID=2975984 RepID=UPI002E29D3B0|nr:GntR family transcriptional regulator [Micromonospora sp. NBC_01699]
MSAEPLITIDPSQPVPPYVQIRAQIADLVVAGELAEGTRLPPVRQLAADLGLATGTVARAYQELEAGGYVTTRRGGGTRVAPQPGATSRRRAAIVQQRAREYVDSLRRLGVNADEAVAAVRDALGER